MTDHTAGIGATIEHDTPFVFGAERMLEFIRPEEPAGIEWGALTFPHGRRFVTIRERRPKARRGFRTRWRGWLTIGATTPFPITTKSDATYDILIDARETR
jgi:hypothetical protein